jgi:hypothetical protein
MTVDAVEDVRVAIRVHHDGDHRVEAPVAAIGMATTLSPSAQNTF